MRPFATAALFASFFVSLALPSALVADERRPVVRLNYDVRDDSCPGERAFRDLIAARLGYDPVDDAAPRAVVVVMAERNRRFDGTLAFFDAEGRPAGERRVGNREPRCAEVAASLASAVALVLDPLGSVARDVQEHAAEPQEAAPEDSAPAVPAAPARETVEPDEPAAPAPPVSLNEDTRPPLAFFAHAGLGAAYGLVPGVSIGARLGLGVDVSHWLLGAEFRTEFTPGSVALGGERAEATLFAARPFGCRRVGLGLLCAGATVGALEGRAPELPPADVRTSVFASVDVLGGVDIPIADGLSLRALAELDALVVRTRLRVDERDLWTAPPVAVSAFVAVAYVFR